MEGVSCNFFWAQSIVSELVANGLRDVLISPGSRSTPLVLAVENEPRLEAKVVVDERSAAFIALGLAKVKRKPVAMICTSGSALANYFPAVVEADLARIPLIILSADRPPEERDCGSPQTIDQVGIFGRRVRYSLDFPVPSFDERSLSQLRRSVGYAYVTSLWPCAGPVHLNLPFREPLMPMATADDQRQIENLPRGLQQHGNYTPTFDTTRATASGANTEIEKLANLARHYSKGWIVAGPDEADEELGRAIAALAERLQWPLFADVLSPAASVASPCHILAGGNLLKSRVWFDAMKPQIVLRFGAIPTAKSFRSALEEEQSIVQWVVDPLGKRDPTLRAEKMIQADPLAFCEVWLGQASPSIHVDAKPYLENCVADGKYLHEVLRENIASHPVLSGPSVALALAETVTSNSLVFSASSLAIRDIDAFSRRPIPFVSVLSNRGANGIDGTLSTALGAALASSAPVTLLVGDLAFCHDLGALLSAKSLKANLRIVLVDNHGGGIFEFLPIATQIQQEQFQRYFLTPQEVDYRAVVESFGFYYRQVDSSAELLRLLSAAPPKGVELIHIPVERAVCTALRNSLSQVASSALSKDPEQIDA